MDEVVNLVEQAEEQISQLYKFWLQYQDAIIKICINLMIAAVILIVGLIAARIISGLIVSSTQRRKIDPTITYFISGIVRYSIVVFTVIAALGKIGVQTTSFIAILGAAGLAIGLALQGTLSNFGAGVLLVLSKSIRSGEQVNIAGAEGRVQHIDLFSTTLTRTDGTVVTIPNSRVLGGNIENYSRNRYRLIQMFVSVAGSSDTDRVKQVLTTLINEDDRINRNREIVVRLAEMSASAQKFTIQVWSKSADFSAVTFDLREGIKKRLAQEEIILV